MNIKDLGVVRALHVGTNPPLNNKMIWWDENINKHKVFNFVQNAWVVLDNQNNNGGNYTYLGWSDDESGTNFALTKQPTSNFIGILTSDTEIQNPTFNDFEEWIRIKDWPKVYTHVRFAKNDQGDGFSENLYYEAQVNEPDGIKIYTLFEDDNQGFETAEYDLNLEEGFHIKNLGDSIDDYLQLEYSDGAIPFERFFVKVKILKNNASYSFDFGAEMEVLLENGVDSNWPKDFIYEVRNAFSNLLILKNRGRFGNKNIEARIYVSELPYELTGQQGIVKVKNEYIAFIQSEQENINNIDPTILNWFKIPIDTWNLTGGFKFLNYQLNHLNIGDLDDLQNQVNQLQTQVNNNNQNIQDLQDALDIVDDRSQDNAQDIANLQNSLGDLQNQVNQLQNHYDTLNKNIQDLQDALDNIKDYVKDPMNINQLKGQSGANLHNQIRYVDEENALFIYDFNSTSNDSEDIVPNSGIGRWIKIRKIGAGISLIENLPEGVGIFKEIENTVAKLRSLKGHENIEIELNSQNNDEILIKDRSFKTLIWQARWYLYTDKRWVTNNVTYGIFYYNYNQSGGTGGSPTVSWNQIGQELLGKNTIFGFSVKGRTTSNEVTDLRISIWILNTPIEGVPGIDSNGEMDWREIYNDAINLVPAGGESNDMNRQTVLFDSPIEIEENTTVVVFMQPVGSLSSNRYFYGGVQIFYK